MDTSTSLRAFEDDEDSEDFSLDLPNLKVEIMQKTCECLQRGLTHSYKWLSEILYSLRNHGSNSPSAKLSIDQDTEVYFMAKSYFDLKEYDRCAFFTEKSQASPLVRFLHFYSKYLAGEKRRLDAQTDIIVSNTLSNLEYLKDLRSDLHKMYVEDESQMDGYMLYLYGVVLKKLNLKSEAKSMLLQSVWKEPCLWSGELKYLQFRARHKR